MKNVIQRKLGTNIFAFLLALGIVGLSGCQQANDESVDLNNAVLKNGQVSQIENICTTVCLVAGQHMYVGAVNVGYMGDDLQVQVELTEAGVYLLEAQVELFTSQDELKEGKGKEKKLSNGGAIPGHFDYKMTWNGSDMATNYVLTIPAAEIPDMDCFYIAVHTALSNGETAWAGLCDEDGKGVNLDGAMQFDGKNWGTFFEFCKDECAEEIEFTYAWEDLSKDKASGNDGDYNDLVIKSNVVHSPDYLHLKLFAVARGASYNHAFKIRLPKTGIDEVYGEYSVVEDGDFWVITVFESTKAALPAENWPSYNFAANTTKDDDGCTPIKEVEITIAINEDFEFSADHPYFPFITVHPGTVGAYDLNIYSIAEAEASGSGDSWVSNEIEYPNGIIIPYDWQWPFEKTFIGDAYPDFSPIDDDGFDDSWHDGDPTPGTVFQTCD